MEDTVSRQFARFVTQTTTETLPPAIAVLAKVRVLELSVDRDRRDRTAGPDRCCEHHRQ